MTARPEASIRPMPYAVPRGTGALAGGAANGTRRLVASVLRSRPATRSEGGTIGAIGAPVICAPSMKGADCGRPTVKRDRTDRVFK